MKTSAMLTCILHVECVTNAVPDNFTLDRALKLEAAIVLHLTPAPWSIMASSSHRPSMSILYVLYVQQLLQNFTLLQTSRSGEFQQVRTYALVDYIRW
jgi:hypothetical protein